jgi:phosphatidylserine/phosphatidylglycerophosphate/cardiolipin synthase-like enzyme
MSISLRMCLSLLVLGGPAASFACSAPPADVGDGASAETGCGSPEGTIVAVSAGNGDSTIDGGIDSTHNRVLAGPLVDGKAIGDALYDLVKGAKREVLVEMYEVNESSWLAGRLKDAVATLPPGVDVRVVSNPMMGRGGLFGIFQESREDNVKRVSTFLGIEPSHTAAWQATDFLHFNALHTKLVVVDGARALVTDANLQPQGDPIGSAPDAEGWYQLGVVVEGEIASAIRKDFAAAWHSSAPTTPLPDAPPVVRANSCTHMTALGRRAGDNSETGNPSANFGYEALFLSADQAVRVITPNLNDDDAVSGLARATASADVYLVLSQHFDDIENSLPGWGGNNEAGLRKLTDAAADPCKLHVRWFARDPGVAVQGNVPGAAHAKWASVDGRIMILGSQNLDVQSWRRSRELDVAIDDEATTKRFDTEFQRVWERSPVAFECP